MSQDNPIYKKIIAALGNPDEGLSETEQKVRVFNFETSKGTIESEELFRGAVADLKRFKEKNPLALDQIQAALEQAVDDKHKNLGIAGASPAQILDSIFDDVNQLSPQERKAVLDQIVRIKKNFSEGIADLDKGKGTRL